MTKRPDLPAERYFITGNIKLKHGGLKEGLLEGRIPNPSHKNHFGVSRRTQRRESVQLRHLSGCWRILLLGSTFHDPDHSNLTLLDLTGYPTGKKGSPGKTVTEIEARPKTKRGWAVLDTPRWWTLWDPYRLHPWYTLGFSSTRQ